MNEDLISRSALLEQECFMDDDNGFRCSVVLSTDVRRAPAVDPVTVFKQIGLVKEAFEMAKADLMQVVRCKDCEWFNSVGCAIYIVDESDMPQENDFCSFGKRRAANASGIDIADDIAGLDLEHMARFAMQQALQRK